MALSRKRRRELRHLRKDAQELLDEQRVVLGHAGSVLHTTGRQARHLSDEHLAPRVDRAYEKVRPAVNVGVEAARGAARRTQRFTAPLIAAALVSTIHSLDSLESKEASKAAQQVQRFGEQRGFIEKPKKRRAGGIIALTLGVGAAAAVGYALWQAFRSDDELWVAPEQ